MSKPVFPSLRIYADRLDARGAFAEAQATWLSPDPVQVARLDAALAAHDAGVVAHFYMDPELQGVLTACTWPHIHISDSLVMADRAVAMAEAGVRTIAVLGVDFMSENVRAMLDAAGHSDVAVYRVATDPIGCSLAEAAEAPAYGAYLTEAAQTTRALHVIYINTSLLTKAKAQRLVPTLTCTSGNVVQTILQAFAQVPDLTLFFGPDSYMGGNLRTMFARYAELDDAAIHALHPAHDRASLRRVLAGLHTFEQGTCVVHHLFGGEVVDRVRHHYADAFICAHLEVPGEMFTLAADRAPSGRGVVGSTSNILSFINAKLGDAAARHDTTPLTFVLGTEAGMITPIVRDVQRTLRAQGTGGVVEIVFPVSDQAIAVTGDPNLAIVPGVAGGEGCSTAGGCATCPFMKMNRLDGLFDVLAQIDANPVALSAYRPREYAEILDGKTVAELGGLPILHMRAFGQTGALPAGLVQDICERHVAG